jgi:hypothetical protein
MQAARGLGTVESRRTELRRLFWAAGIVALLGGAAYYLSDTATEKRRQAARRR